MSTKKYLDKNSNNLNDVMWHCCTTLYGYLIKNMCNDNSLGKIMSIVIVGLAGKIMSILIVGLARKIMSIIIVGLA